MRIIIIHDNAKITGGAQKVAITEAAALFDKGYDVTYFSAVGPIDPMLKDRKMRVICLDQKELKDELGGKTAKIKGVFRGLYNKAAYQELNMLLKEYNPEDTIVHIHGWSLALSPSIFKAIYKNNLRAAITCHDYEINCPVRTYFNYQTNTMCKIEGMSFKCLCTNCDKRSYAQKLYRVLRQKVFYRYAKKTNLSLIYLSQFNKGLIEKDLRLKVKGYIVPNLIDIPPAVHVNAKSNHKYLFIGRLNPEKGGRLFCEAVTKAGVEGLLIGSGSEYESLKREFNKVEFAGWKTANEMASIIPNGRCFVMSSICYEGAPLTIPEIQGAYALPCIVPNPSGALSYIRHNENGLIFISGDLDGLVESIKLLEDDETIERMSNNCKATFDEKQYSKDTHIEKLINAYNEILKS